MLLEVKMVPWGCVGRGGGSVSGRVHILLGVGGGPAPMCIVTLEDRLHLLRYSKKTHIDTRILQPSIA